MILSYHPCYVGDKNLLCAGRDPDETDKAAIKKADAVILPQGSTRLLFEMAAANCKNVFPNYTQRFKYPGKTGQAGLFRKYGANHPETLCFKSTNEFYDYFKTKHVPPPFGGYPFVFKFTWSGEGENVWLIHNKKELTDLLKKAGDFEKTGQKGFVLQRYIETKGRSLRVVIIHDKSISYWRIQTDPAHFATQHAQGAVIDHHADPDLRGNAAAAVKNFAAKTGINLAGFDIVFDTKDPHAEPLFLEINYYFGRRGLGGSEAFYDLLYRQISRWLSSRTV